MCTVICREKQKIKSLLKTQWVSLRTEKTAIFTFKIHKSHKSDEKKLKIQNIFNFDNCIIALFCPQKWSTTYLPVRHGEYSENLENASVAVKQVPTGSRLRLLMEK